MKFKKNDLVKVVAGRDAGRQGKIEKVFPKTEQVMLAGINIAKRHLKKRDEKHPGGIIDIPQPLSVAKIALICPTCHIATRVGWQVAGRDKYRICRKCGHKI